MDTHVDYDTKESGISEVHLASDHAGFEMKEIILEHLQRNNYTVVDHGAYEYDEDDDYPDFVAPAVLAVAQDRQSRGIILGGSGQGEAMVANRFPGVRAVVFVGQPDSYDGKEVPQAVSTARQHNDANVLSLGARFLTKDEALEAVDQFLETSFSGEERHVRRIQKIESLGNLLG